MGRKYGSPFGNYSGYNTGMFHIQPLLFSTECNSVISFLHWVYCLGIDIPNRLLQLGFNLHCVPAEGIFRLHHASQWCTAILSMAPERWKKEKAFRSRWSQGTVIVLCAGISSVRIRRSIGDQVVSVIFFRGIWRLSVANNDGWLTFRDRETALKWSRSRKLKSYPSIPALRPHCYTVGVTSGICQSH